MSIFNDCNDDGSTDTETVASDRKKHYTLLFNTFVFLHVFNEMNCRKIGVKQFNIFAGFFSNFLFTSE